MFTTKQQFSSEIPLLWNNNGVSLEQLLTMIEGEINEAEQARHEYETSPSPERLQHLADEHNDMLVLASALSFHFSRKWFADPRQHYSGNGDGSHSNIYERLRNLVPELSKVEGLMQFFALLQSADYHLPVPYAGIISYSTTLDKVLGNYPASLMQTTDISGQNLSDENQVVQFQVRKKGLRIMRDAVNQTSERPLTTLDVAPWEDVLIQLGSDYPHAAIQVLHTALLGPGLYPASELEPTIMTPIPVPEKYQLAPSIA